MARDTAKSAQFADVLRHNALAAAGVGGWLLDTANNQVEIDATTASLLEMNQISPQRLDLDEFLFKFDPNDRARLGAQISVAAGGGAPLNTSALRSQAHADGGVVHIAMRGRPLGEGQHAAGLLGGACWDITDSKRLEL